MSGLLNFFTVELFLATLRLAIPLALASIGATICERSGIVNLGIEGMMLAGAFGGVLGVHLTNNSFMGVLFAGVIGGLFGFLHGLLCIKFKTNQTVCGVGINIFSAGLTVVLTRAVWKSDGISGTVKPFPTFTIDVFKNVPILGKIFTNQSPYLILTLFILFICWFLMYKTKVGLRLRAIGDHPKAAESAGININLYRYGATICCGILCGLGGTYLSIVQNNQFVNNMTAGRGFMALAANIFGGWNPLGSFFASFIFAFAQAIRINLSLKIPDQFLQMIPYVITLLVLLGVGRKANAPEALGEIE